MESKHCTNLKFCTILVQISMLKYSLFRIFAFIFCLSLVLHVAVLAEFSTDSASENLFRESGTDSRSWMKYPTVFVSVLVRNKAHTLPWFLYYLQNLNYPKQRIRLWLRTDHNVDNSVSLLEEWLSRVRYEYNHVDFVDDGSRGDYSDSKGVFDWSDDHMRAVIGLRQKALDAARASWADYILFVDADNFLLNADTLLLLISEERPIISPMLNVTTSEQYSNFWCGFDENGYVKLLLSSERASVIKKICSKTGRKMGYYRRTDDYLPIRYRHQMAVHPVALVHSVILIELRDPSTRLLAYHPPPPGYRGPSDDIIILAHSAQYHGVGVSLVNKEFYGYMLVPLEAHNTLEKEREQLIHTRLENIVLGEPLKRLEYLDEPRKASGKIGVDQIYMINLERRPDRRIKMEQSFYELNINATLVKAVDGRLLNDTYLKKLGIKMMEGYADPYGGRHMTMGEIGCFLSHYNIWLDILEKGYKSVIVFEDDIRFKPFFHYRFQHLMKDLQALDFSWDLVYLGRKRLYSDDEPYVLSSRTLVWPLYSYWTLSYMLSHEGARKLVEQRPLDKLVPVDEYLPIMFNQHPQDDWKKNFSPRDLVTMSAYPLLVEPTHYTGEPGYITDTENSVVIDEELIVQLKGDPAPTSPAPSSTAPSSFAPAEAATDFDNSAEISVTVENLAENAMSKEGLRDGSSLNVEMKESSRLGMSLGDEL